MLQGQDIVPDRQGDETLQSIGRGLAAFGGASFFISVLFTESLPASVAGAGVLGGLGLMLAAAAVGGYDIYREHKQDKSNDREEARAKDGIRDLIIELDLILSVENR